MIRQYLSVVLGSILFLQAIASVRGNTSPQANASQNQTAAEKVMAFPAGTLVEVRLKTKEKLRGRIGERSNEAFELQIPSGNKVETRKITYDEVKGIKSLEGQGHGNRLAWGVLGGVIGVVTILFILAKIYAGG